MADVKKTAEEKIQYDPQYILQVKDLKKYFPIKGGMLNKTVGYVKAVDGVTFNLKRGTTMGLVGESGCGKTTTGRTILRLSGEKTGGQVLFNGQEVYDLPPKEMRRICGEKIGMIFQDCGASLSPTRTIGEQIIESMAAHRKVDVAEAKRAALELFEKLHFQDGERIWDSYPFELSGGMNQRAGIAIAMLMNPAVLLADEPTSALDMAVQRQVVEEMLHVREAFGTAIIIVSHDIGVVSAMADSIVVLSNGRVMEYAAAKDVLENPQNDYTVKLLSAVPRLRREKA